MNASLALLLTQIIAGIVGAALVGIGALAIVGWWIGRKNAQEYFEGEE